MKQPGEESSSGSDNECTETHPLLSNPYGSSTQPPPYQPPQRPPSTTSTPDAVTQAGNAVLVRADGTGVCLDGTQHVWKQVYPPSSWLVACICFACCGPLCCHHPQRQCTKCGTLILNPAA
ncbi:hypothetical protein GGI25_000767 [Coemansia spiralis]|uniref:Brain protein I3 n=2 Tax=Coemansia TaxID=4863 RepID=A0A9W8L0W3_9FUNG|nr:hypothetical protein EDC05_005865 [Coemansia umbellata]KAJ2621943.1 hypothetical protein GGI26_003647 [Coemansia sp. RSA 1358]KAJ2680475.1 hypothetical protein GGI25_000767 [Coemansia spiralis]